METVNKNSASVLLCSYYVIKDNKSINLHHHHLNNKPASYIITLIEPNLARAGQKPFCQDKPDWKNSQVFKGCPAPSNSSEYRENLFVSRTGWWPAIQTSCSF